LLVVSEGGFKKIRFVCPNVPALAQSSYSNYSFFSAAAGFFLGAAAFFLGAAAIFLGETFFLGSVACFLGAAFLGAAWTRRRTSNFDSEKTDRSR